MNRDKIKVTFISKWKLDVSIDKLEKLKPGCMVGSIGLWTLESLVPGHLNSGSLRKRYLYLELFWSVFSRIRTECGEIWSISPYLVQMQKNEDQNNSEYIHFSRSGCLNNSAIISWTLDAWTLGLWTIDVWNLEVWNLDPLIHKNKILYFNSKGALTEYGIINIALSGLRQLLAVGSPLNMMKKCFLFQL